MGVSLAERDLPSNHAYRAARRFAAINKRESEFLKVRMQLAEAERQLSAWKSWWQSTGTASTPWETSYACERVLHHLCSQSDMSPDFGPVDPEGDGVNTARDTHEIGVQVDMVTMPIAPGFLPLSRVEKMMEQTAAATAEKVASTLSAKFELKLMSLADDVARARAEASAMKRQFEKKCALCDHLASEVEHLKEELAELNDHDSERSCAVSQGTAAEMHNMSFADTRMRGDCRGLCRNDLCLPLDFEDRVDWGRCQELQGEFGAAFCSARAEGYFICSICSVDICEARGAYGHAFITDNNADWETKNLWNLVDDPPAQLRCFACHFQTIDCMFYKAGNCFRGGFCAYRHADASAEIASTTTKVWPSYLDAADLQRLSAASNAHRCIASSFMPQGLDHLSVRVCE